MKASKEQIEQWKREVQIALRTPAYEGIFERYWDITAVLRTKMSEEDCNEAKAVKLAAWNERNDS